MAESSRATTSPQGPAVQPGLAPLVELLRQRLALEPLEHRVRHQRARGRREGRAAADAPHDVQVALGELVLEAALVAKAAHERLDERRAEGRGQLQALDRDRLGQADVRAAVDDAEAALADMRIDAELAVENLAHEAERVRGRRHAPNDTSYGPP